MANVNIAQIRTMVQSLPTGSTCLIHASVLLSLLNQYKTSAGSEVVLTAVTPGSNRPPIDLTQY